MVKLIKYSVIVICFIIFFYWVLKEINHYLGWTALRKWERRMGSLTLAEAKYRNTFVKELKFSKDFEFASGVKFEPFIERGFYCTKKKESETIIDKHSSFPYQLRFDYKPVLDVTILINKDQLLKFDSSNASWGYMKEPILRDTLEVLYHDAKTKFEGIIKIYE